MNGQDVRTYQSVITVTLAFAVIAGLRWLMRRSRPEAGDASGGTIRPSRVLVGIAILIGAAMVAGGIALFLFDPRSPKVGLVAAAAGLVIGILLAPSMTTAASITWSNAWIEGPATRISRRSRRTRMPWEDASRCGVSWDGSWYLEDRNGGRIYWSYLHKGYGALVLALRHHCPNLKLPPRLV